MREHRYRPNGSGEGAPRVRRRQVEPPVLPEIPPPQGGFFGGWTWQLIGGVLIGLGLALLGLAIYNIITA